MAKNKQDQVREEVEVLEEKSPSLPDSSHESRQTQDDKADLKSVSALSREKVEKKILDEIGIDKKKNKVGWKRIGIIFAVLMVLWGTGYVFGMYQLGWELPNRCGFKNTCTDNGECSKIWACTGDDLLVDEVDRDRDRAQYVKPSSKPKLATDSAEVEEGKEIDFENLEEISLGEMEWLGEHEAYPVQVVTSNLGGSGLGIPEINRSTITRFNNDSHAKVARFDDGKELIYLENWGAMNSIVLVRMIKDGDKTYILCNERLLDRWIVDKEFVDMELWYEYEKDDQSYGKLAEVEFVVVSEEDENKFLLKDEVEYKGKILEKKFGFRKDILIEELELVKETNERNIYKKYLKNKTEEKVSDDFSMRELYLLFVDGYFYEYKLKDEMFTDDRVPKITWADGGRNDMNFEGRVLFLGHYMPGFQIPVVADGAITLEDKIKIGDLDIGEEVYQLKGIGNELVEGLWDSYVSYGSSWNGEDKLNSIEEFNNQINHFLWQDVFGDWQIFVNSKFVPAVEMGKPVIYLYPEEEMMIDVEVGAEVRISEPFYPEGGWRDIMAYPTGELIYQGQKYESLFWEGMGHGGYEFLEDEGVVVKGNKVWRTVEKQMIDLGLNEKERSDFWEFWTDKLPYGDEWVRLSWYMTEDLDRMAPLSIIPKPDTIIRVFLDWQVLPEYKRLKVQNLTKIDREGFTVVEWGGLLIR